MKKVSPSPFQKLSGILVAAAHQSKESRRKATDPPGRDFLEKSSLPGSPPQKLFKIFSWLAQAKTKTAKSVFRLIFISPSGESSSVSGGNRYHPRYADIICLLSRTDIIACDNRCAPCPRNMKLLHVFVTSPPPAARACGTPRTGRSGCSPKCRRGISSSRT